MLLDSPHDIKSRLRTRATRDFPGAGAGVPDAPGAWAPEQNLVQAQIGYRRALTAVDRATAQLLDQYGVKVD